MADTYNFDEDIQLQILTLLKDKILTPTEILPEYFDNPILAGICQGLITLFDVYDLTPSMLAHELRTILQSTYKQYLPDIKKYFKTLFQPMEETHVHYIQQLAHDFAEFVLYKKAIMHSAHIIRNPDKQTLTKLKNIWQTLHKSTNNTTRDVGTFYFDDLHNRLRHRLQHTNVLQSLIPELDIFLEEGGFGKGELNLFVGTPGTGKSMLLSHMAKAALFQKKKVVYYSYEMSQFKVATRFDAALSNIKTSELRDNTQQVAKSIQRYGKIFHNSLLIKEMIANKSTVHNIHAHIDQLHRIGFRPDVLVVDYINLVAPARVTTSRYADLGEVYVDLRAIAQEYNAWLFTAAQGNRGAYKSEFVTMADLAESFIGCMTADVIISLNQTRDEWSQGQMRLYIAKNRSELDKQLIAIYTDYAHGSFYRRSTT